MTETEVVAEGVVWKIKKALCGLRTSPIAWETERNNTVRGLKWTHEETEYRLLPCQGSPCLWTVPIRPGEDPSIKTSKQELTRGVVITCVDDLLLTGWHHHKGTHQAFHEEVWLTSYGVISLSISSIVFKRMDSIIAMCQIDW